MTLLIDKFTDIISIIPAAGIGQRMKSSVPKQYCIINDKTLLEHSIGSLLYHPYIKRILVAINNSDKWFHKLPIANDPRINIVIGGTTRAKSVMAALDYADSSGFRATWVLIHDAVRPCLSQSDLIRLLSITSYSKIGGILATPVRDTIKRVSINNDNIIINSTIIRNNLWHSLTPQIFDFYLLKNCLKKSLEEGHVINDDASALENYGYKPLLVPGRVDNIKVTHPEDLYFAKFYYSNINKNGKN